MEPWDGDLAQVVIETPKDTANKLKFEPRLGAFRLGKVLPAGMTFPFDFGFLPGSRGGDGDPLDVLVLMDSPAFPGCVIPSRIVGVLQAEQTERDGTTERNDRLLAVADASMRHRDIRE